MIRKEIDIHLEALAGYVNDEDKLVTYKWLSKELNIHVNLSKQILFEYWDNRQRENDPIMATFLLIGYLRDGGMRVDVVKEADLSSAKKKFSQVISEHIYSLQNTLPEIELLAITDKGNSDQSAVRCAESVIRSEHEMELLRWGSSLDNNKTVKNVQNSTTNIHKRTNAETKSGDQLNNIGRESTAKINAGKTGDKTQKSAFNNLFAKAIDKQNKEKASSDNAKSKTGTVAKNCPPKNAWFEAMKKPKEGKVQSGRSNDIAECTVDGETSKAQRVSAPVVSQNVNNKAAAGSDDSGESPPKKNAWFEAKKKPKSGKEQPENSNGLIESTVVDKKREQSPESKKSGKREVPEKNVGFGESGGKKKTASSLRGKKRQSSARNESISKRRKRIVVVESSDESNDSQEMQDIEEPDSPEEPQVIEKIITCPSPPLVKCEGGRRKVRKLVDKTFMDDDGYFVTKKEYVYESCSDNEEEVVQVNIVKPSVSEPIVKNTNKRKQATLLNFFKKS